jgi:hypothetical protein
VPAPVEEVTVVAGFAPVAGAPRVSPVTEHVGLGTVPTVVDVLLAVMVTEMGGVTVVVVVLVEHGVGPAATFAPGAPRAASTGTGPCGSVVQPGPAQSAVFDTLPVVPELIVTVKDAPTESPIGTSKKSHVRVFVACEKVHVVPAGSVLGQAGVPLRVVPVGTMSVMATFPAAVADAEFVAVSEYVIGVAVSPAK